MNFLEAVVAMKEGKKVTRDTYEDEIYIHYKGEHNTICFNGVPTHLNANDVEATDWEIAEDNWNWLHNKTSSNYTADKQEDLETLKKKILDDLDNSKDNIQLYDPLKTIKEIINKRFGF